MAVTKLTPRCEENEPKNIPYKMRSGPVHNAIHWFDLRLAPDKDVEFWKTINNAIIVYDSVRADCLVENVRRNLDDTEAEILYDRREPEQRDFPRIRLQEKSRS